MKPMENYISTEAEQMLLNKVLSFR